MSELTINFKRLSRRAVMPKFGREGDAGADLTAIEIVEIEDDNDTIKYNFGIAVEIPKGYVGLIFPRSSIYKKKQILTNSVGVIDSNYRGELSAVMTIGLNDDLRYQVGERIAQLVIVPIPTVTFVQVDELSETNRGDGAYGSSGDK